MSFVVAPNRHMYECWKPKKDKDAIVEWLAAHRPREWHVAADIWNWDGGIDVLALILEQPQCDRATCQMVFGRSEADYYLTSKDLFHKAKNDPRSVLNAILNMLSRWRRGFYTAGHFSLPEDDLGNFPRVVNRYQSAVVEHWNSDPGLMLPQDFMVPIKGELVDPNFYWDRNLIPEELQP